MSYCRSPVYIICNGSTGKIECFDVSNPELSSQHHHGIIEMDSVKGADECAFEHMRWHAKRFKEECKFDEAHWLEDQILDALTTPYYTKWYHRLDPWRWLFWRRYHKVYDWLEEEE